MLVDKLTATIQNIKDRKRPFSIGLEGVISDEDLIKSIVGNIKELNDPFYVLSTNLWIDDGAEIKDVQGALKNCNWFGKFDSYSANIVVPAKYSIQIIHENRTKFKGYNKKAKYNSRCLDREYNLRVLKTECTIDSMQEIISKHLFRYRHYGPQ